VTAKPDVDEFSPKPFADYTTYVLQGMWVALTAYQAIADAKGFGIAWRQMLSEKTREAALKASWEADIFDERAADAAMSAAGAIADMDSDGVLITSAEGYATRAVWFILAAQVAA
jgi:hypothetical protein